MMRGREAFPCVDPLAAGHKAADRILAERQRRQEDEALEKRAAEAEGLEKKKGTPEPVFSDEELDDLYKEDREEPYYQK